MDELKLKRLKEIRNAAMALNNYPEIIGEEPTLNYPETKLERAYCNFLWAVDEAIRAEGKKA